MIDFPDTEVGPTATPTKNGTLIQSAHGKVQEMLTKLLPFTQYAFYVETMIALTSPNTTTGRSEIVYFTTTESSEWPAPWAEWMGTRGAPRPAPHRVPPPPGAVRGEGWEAAAGGGVGQSMSPCHAR